jgi:hypothetical protein
LLRPLNVYAPELFAVVVAVAAPPNVTVAPPPPATGLIVPEMLKVCVLLELFTVTATAALVDVFPAASLATAVRLCVPLLAFLVSHDNPYGAAVSAALAFAPSIWNCTLSTPTLSAAVAVALTTPDTVAPAAGAVSDTVGAVESPDPDPPPEAVAVENVPSLLTAVSPLASVERTR